MSQPEGRGVAAVILAAGASTRLGTAKQMITLGGETLLMRSIRVAAEAGFSPVYCVLSAALAQNVAVHGAVVVVNEQADEGMASSIRAGVRAAQGDGDVEGVVILACDQPAVTAAHLRQLSRGGAAIVGSSYAGKKGVPAYFPASAFGALLELKGDFGARELMRDSEAIWLPGGEVDVDTVDDLAVVLQRYSS